MAKEKCLHTDDSRGESESSLWWIYMQIQVKWLKANSNHCSTWCKLPKLNPSCEQLNCDSDRSDFILSNELNLCQSAEMWILATSSHCPALIQVIPWLKSSMRRIERSGMRCWEQLTTDREVESMNSLYHDGKKHYLLRQQTRTWAFWRLAEQRLKVSKLCKQKGPAA